MTDYESFREKLLSDPDVLKEYEAHKTEYEVAMSLIKARLASNMTQADVAKRMRTSQAQIARLESGHHFPSALSFHSFRMALSLCLASRRL